MKSELLSLIGLAGLAVVGSPTKASPVMFAPGTAVVPAVADTYFADDDSGPRGSGNRLIAGMFHADFVTLIRFDVQANVPSNATIQNAEVRMYCESSLSEERNRRVQLYLRAIRDPWDEFTVVRATRPGVGDPTIPWRVNGCDPLVLFGRMGVDARALAGTTKVYLDRLPKVAGGAEPGVSRGRCRAARAA